MFPVVNDGECFYEPGLPVLQRVMLQARKKAEKETEVHNKVINSLGYK
jgi:hypothetical protein